MPISNMGSNGKGKPFRPKTKKDENRESGLKRPELKEKPHAFPVEKR